jgi:hypothetical protein
MTRITNPFRLKWGKDERAKVEALAASAVATSLPLAGRFVLQSAALFLGWPPLAAVLPSLTPDRLTVPEAAGLVLLGHLAGHALRRVVLALHRPA